VFVSSTLGELAEERRAVSRAISALRLTPVMFEAGARRRSSTCRAARLKGAAEGLRRRVGLPTWPDLRRLDEELVTQTASS
jgi:Domain of unknown function (DUF4062)